MMAVGLVGEAIFAGLAWWSADVWEDADVERYVRFARFAGCFFLPGFLLCVISNLWILISAVAFLIRRKSAKQTAAAWMLPWFAIGCLLAPGNLQAGGSDWSRSGHGKTNEPARDESALSNSSQIPGVEHRGLDEQLRRATIQMVDKPTQKEIILYDQGRENMVLQVKYEGPDQAFGWLIPVPGLPEVRQGSMNCFYDLTRLTQEPLWSEEFDESSLLSSQICANRIRAVEIKTIGAFEVAVLAPQDTKRLSR